MAEKIKWQSKISLFTSARNITTNLQTCQELQVLDIHHQLRGDQADPRPHPLERMLSSPTRRKPGVTLLSLSDQAQPHHRTRSLLDTSVHLPAKAEVDITTTFHLSQPHTCLPTPTPPSEPLWKAPMSTNPFTDEICTADHLLLRRCPALGRELLGRAVWPSEKQLGAIPTRKI